MAEHVTLSKRELDWLNRILAYPISELRTAERVGLWCSTALGALMLPEWLLSFDIGAPFLFMLIALGSVAAATVHREARLLKHQEQIIRRLSGDDDDPLSGVPSERQDH